MECVCERDGGGGGWGRGGVELSGVDIDVGGGTLVQWCQVAVATATFHFLAHKRQCICNFGIRYLTNLSSA